MPHNTFACPNCAELLPANARVCKHCGSDENTGWSDNTYLDGIDLPFEDDDYEKIKNNEFSGTSAGRRYANSSVRINWKMIIGILVLTAMLFAVVFRGGC